LSGWLRALISAARNLGETSSIWPFRVFRGIDFTQISGDTVKVIFYSAFIDNKLKTNQYRGAVQAAS